MVRGALKLKRLAVRMGMLGVGCCIAGGIAHAQAPLEVGQDGHVTTNGIAAIGVSAQEGQRLAQVGKWQMLELEHTLTALLAEDDVMLSFSPRRGGDVFLMFVLKGQEVKDPALSVRFSNGLEVKSFHYTGIINRGTQWGCYVSEAEGKALFAALAQSHAVTMVWSGGQKQVEFAQGAEFVQNMRETAQHGHMPFPQ
ncbi:MULTISPECIES: hypothetical protein [Bombella]|uniref:Invasion associated locus B (IalB) protein n=1 Tax=Bombella pollinis TaxID=2967337 RepID=A0ABT3WKH6_9PROT|nr:MULTISPECIES: hypothetical protein [Bombella]MCT6856118.1 hypothetical protein [Bombella apis]MCX5618814.1 hypothetical protein [Bombella pollinis]MUG04164.1 hypothetical protein [Bombella sp. ESL0378]MUG89661.1 hypothetical protein [Bombella sp. ESL0385]